MYYHHLIEEILLVVYSATYKKRLTVLIMKYFWLKWSFMGSLEQLFRKQISESICE